MRPIAREVVLNLPKHPKLRSPHGPADAAERTRLIQRAIRKRDELKAYFATVEHWNTSVRKPNEEAIDPDPDGQMQRILTYYNELIAGAVD